MVALSSQTGCFAMIHTEKGEVQRISPGLLPHYLGDLSIELGYRLEEENRLLTKKEAYEQISHSASVFKGISGYAGG